MEGKRVLQFALDRSVILRHDRPWSVKWQCEGSWTGGGFLLSSNISGNSANTLYLFRNSNGIYLGQYTGSRHEQWGINPADYGVDISAAHSYTLINRIEANGTNMVYLSVDGQELGALNRAAVNGSFTGETSDFLSGKDFTFSYVGAKEFPINDIILTSLAVNESCGHSYEAVVTAPSCTAGGDTTFTCTLCGDSYIAEEMAPSDHSYTGKVTQAPGCTAPGVRTYTCTGCGASYAEGIPALGHSYSGGICTTCGDMDPAYDPNIDHYLFGYINGANYACEEDYENMGSYKFVDGKLTATFTQDSYVGVKAEGNAAWYMTDGWLGSNVTSATLYNTETLFSADKLFVPGGVELTFTLFNNGDGTLTPSYESAKQEATAPTIAMKYPTVSFEDVIVMNIYYQASDLEDVVEMGLLTYSEQVDTASVATAEHVVPGYTYNSADGMYFSSTSGIAPKDIGDTIYFAVYYKLADGTGTMANLASACAVYGYYAKQLFN